MTTTDHRPPVRPGDREIGRPGDKRTGVFSGLLVSWSPCLLVRATRCLSFVVLLLALAACGAAPGDAASQADLAGGSRFGPESVAENFFKDLRDALKDPALADDAGRSKWAEKLANYFAPNERDDQRAALHAALSNFTDGLKQLDATQIDDRGVVIPEFEQEIGFENITGRSDGAVPTIKIGDRWYLTEG
jgi:hypothetical protein